MILLRKQGANGASQTSIEVRQYSNSPLGVLGIPWHESCVIKNYANLPAIAGPINGIALNGISEVKRISEVNGIRFNGIALNGIAKVNGIRKQVLRYDNTRIRWTKLGPAIAGEEVLRYDNTQTRALETGNNLVLRYDNTRIAPARSAISNKEINE